MTKDIYVYPKGIYGNPPSASKPTKDPIQFDVVGTVTKTNVTIDEASNHLIDYCLQGKSLYSIAMLMEDGTINISDRPGQPCIGSLRTYGSQSLRPLDYFPGDLRTPERTFPLGKPILLGFPNTQGYTKEFAEATFLSSDGPWCSIVHALQPVYDKNDTMKGILVKDTNISPTMMINLLRKIRYTVKKDPPLVSLPPRVQVLYRMFGWNWAEAFGGRPDIARLLAGEPVPGLDEDTFYNRWPYNRPLIDYVFGYKADAKMPVLGPSAKWDTLKPELY